MKKTSTIFLSLLLVSGLALAGTVKFYSGQNQFNLNDENTSVKIDIATSPKIENVTVKGDRIETAVGDFIVNNSGGKELNVNITTFNPPAGAGNTAVAYNASSTNNNTIEFTVNGLIAGNKYAILRDGSNFKSKTANRGSLTFKTSNWSSHQFQIVNDNNPPSVSLSLGSSSVSEGYSIDISCSSSDSETKVVSESLTVTQPDGDTISTSCGTSFDKTGQTGDYTVDYSATDDADNTNSTSDTFSVTSTSSSSSDSSGGGGGLPSFSGLSKSWVGTSGTSFSARDTSDRVPALEEVSFETSEETSPESLEAKEVEKDEVERNAEPTTNVRSYLSIEVSGVSDDQITSSSIKFSVEKDWADQKKRVYMSRYKNGWEDLPTKKVSETTDSVVYKSSASGFSYYAVRAENKTEDTTEDTTNQTEQQNETVVTQPDNQTQTSDNETSGKTVKDRGVPVEIVIAVLLLSAIVSTAYFFRDRLMELYGDTGAKISEKAGYFVDMNKEEVKDVEDVEEDEEG